LACFIAEELRGRPPVILSLDSTRETSADFGSVTGPDPALSLLSFARTTPSLSGPVERRWQ
jgi:hypothetical protein